MPGHGMLAATPSLPEQDDQVQAWVDALLAGARASGASDLHIDPRLQGAQLRLRIHGLLQDWLWVPLRWQQRLVARLKMLARLDLAEQRLPQDGRLNDGCQGSIRIASLPTLHGEKLCLRLTGDEQRLQLDDLNLPAPVADALRKALAHPDGLILITGPTGSGKTTTLYACLQALDRQTRHLATIEDPIEHVLPGISQTAIQPRIGLDFGQVLRALLRQDPDVMMVGEIRDPATAEMVVQAAETGHLVLSTLHTGSALEALTRLRHLGVPPWLLADSVRLVLAQRLVRQRCPHCAPELPGQAGRGCTHCHQGYVGRLGLYECLLMTVPLAHALQAGAEPGQLLQLAHAGGLPTLAASARDAIASGLTTYDEVQRVLGPCACPA